MDRITTRLSVFRYLPHMIAVFILFALMLSADGISRAANGDGADYSGVEKQAKKDIVSTDRKMRIAAIHAIAATNDPRGVKFLATYVRDEKDPDVVTQFAAAMGMFTDPKAVEGISKYALKLTTADQIYFAYNILAGLAMSSTPETREVVLAALKQDKSAWLMVAALEAMGDSSRTPFLVELKETVIDKKKDDWNDKTQIIPITAVHSIAKLGALDPKGALESIETLIVVLEHYSDDRIRYHTAKVLGRLAGLQETTDQVDWWRYWVERTKQGLAVEDGGQKMRSRKTGSRPEFVEMAAVGTHIVFVLDISNSMGEPVSTAAKKKRMDIEAKARAKRDANDPRKPIPWGSITNKMDLAKADLIQALEMLTDKYYFNVIVYSTESASIDTNVKGFVQATAANKNKFINLVRQVGLGTMTNIHGGMTDAFQMTDKGMISGDPAVNEEALYHGADTIFFHTDGWGSWSDDSKGKVVDPRRPEDKTPLIGDGEHIMAADILTDFQRINKFRKVVVNTVGVGNHDSELMSGFAARSGGTYIDLGD